MGNILKHEWKTTIRVICVLLVCLFILISGLFITPVFREPKSNYHSSELEQITSQDGNVTRTDFVDDRGKVTIAADLGYATKVVTKTNEGEYEEYLDDKGDSVRRYYGYYILFREYDETGNHIRSTYLDLDGRPVNTIQGYAIEENKYDKNGKVVMIRYLNTERKPVLSSFGYGKVNEYNENGKVICITYVDEHGHPMMMGNGYSKLTRNYYEYGNSIGKVESEFYFDDNGKPVALSIGQFGVHKEYNENGQETVLTYLDEEGKPIVTTKGYTTIRRTYHVNNSIATEKYYDIDGEPFSLSEGQYGFRRENGQIIYLDSSGKDIFNIRNILYNRSWLVILSAVLIVLFSTAIDWKWNMILFFIYIGAICYLTLMYRESGETKINIDFFWSYLKIINDSELRSEIIKNIWLFVPLGAICYRLYPRKIILFVPFILSISIELVQYITRTGLCELDDVVSNELGGVIGYGAEMLVSSLRDYLQAAHSYTRVQK